MSNHTLPDAIWNVLACPHCGTSLKREDQAARCESCGAVYSANASMPLDLRLTRTKKAAFEFAMPFPALEEADSLIRPLALKPNPEVDFSGIPVPHHLSAEMLSHFPKAKGKDSLALDLGCGDAIHRSVCEQAGFIYAGLDYGDERAPLLGDAHALPFCENSFEFVLSIAVLEHIRFPFFMMKETHRVLKPGGVFIGTVSFLEPYHAYSFYHQTHYGVYHSLTMGGFKVQWIAPSQQWSGLAAQAKMSLFPKFPAALSRAMVLPIEWISKCWWRIGRLYSPNLKEESRLLHNTGAFTFIAMKE